MGYEHLHLKSLISPVGWVHVLCYIMLYSKIDMYNVTIINESINQIMMAMGLWRPPVATEIRGGPTCM